MAYTRRSELTCTEAELVTYGDKVLMANELLAVKMSDGRRGIIYGDGVTPIKNLPYSINYAEVAAKATAANQSAASALSQANRAKAEADRAAGIDAYTKTEADTLLNKKPDKDDVALVKDKVNDLSNILSTMNPFQSPSQTVAGYDKILPLPVNAANGNASFGLKGQTLKNELNYNNTTWAEWTKTTGVVGDSTGLEFTSDGAASKSATLSGTSFKPSTQYGFLYFIVNNSITGNFGTDAGIFDYKTFTKTTGNNKAVAISKSAITQNALKVYTYLATETSGNKIKLANLRVFELPSGSEIESDFTNMTADQLAIKYPYFSGDSLRSVKSRGRARSVGKNLVYNGNQENMLGGIATGYPMQSTGFTFDWGDPSSATVQNSPEGYLCNNTISNGRGFGSKTLIPVVPNSTLTLSYQVKTNTGTPSVRSMLYFYDASKKFISYLQAIHIPTSDFVKMSRTGVVPSGAAYLVWQVMSYEYNSVSPANKPFIVKEVQLEFGSSATPYEPHVHCEKYINSTEPLRRAPNGIQDEIRQRADGGYELVQGCKEYTLVAEDIYSLNTTLVNVDMVSVLHEKLAGLLNSGIADSLATKAITSVSCPANGAVIDSSAGFWRHYFTASYLYIVVPKGTYANLAAAQAALAGTKIIYQLATPIVTTVDTSGMLMSYPSGSVYWEPITADAGVYNSGISILATGFPTASLETLSKVDFMTGAETVLDVSTAVIASDGLSFTHLGLANGDIALYTYSFKSDAPEGSKAVGYYDSRYVIKDSVTGKFYQWGIAVANGTPTIGLTEV